MVKEVLDEILVETSYGVEQIDSLDGLEAVRKRPGMYIGSTSQKGATHLVWEVADNSIDEFMAGYGKEIWVHVAKDATVTIKDNGRGIPVGKHHRWKNADGTPMNTLTGILTKLHAGGKFNGKDSGYKVSGGLHGVGTKAVNALSDSFTATVRREGKIWKQTFSKGEPTSSVEEIGECNLNDTGTIISYHPDPSIFKLTLEPNCKDLQTRMNELASLNAGLTIHYENEITKINKTYFYEDGILGFTKRMVEGKNLLYDNPFYMKGNYTLDNEKTIIVEISFIHDDEVEANEIIKSFANNINTYEGGFHLKGFIKEYGRQINQIGIDNKIINEPIEQKYLLDGIYAIVSVKVPEAEFEGQTKTKLGNAEAQNAVEDVIAKGFETLLKKKENMEILTAIVTRAQKVKEAEEFARKQRSLKRKTNAASKVGLPGKLADCENKSGYSEIYLVEGDSAAGSAKQGRSRWYQAVLPLKGKINNAEKTDMEKLLKSEAIKDLICAFRAGFDKDFDINKVPYDKIIIMTDADADGTHIKLLLLTFFYNFMRPLIMQGRVFVAVPPLYRVSKGAKGDYIYLKDEHELKEFKKKNNGKFEVQRFKGLGEMNPDQLRETSMHPSSRILKRITVQDAANAQEVIEILMGKKVDLRRDFIEANAYRVNLDFM